uniref:Nodule-specific cysteine-rich peptide L56 n=1 Tax=Lens culinaris TaxID=3864 RepID=A0A7T8DVG3_LENCU|nr:nodule-specific cysteine-rich peptide L56 [Lens culinaris]
MEKIVKIFYVMIMFLFLFFVSSNVEGVPCSETSHCPKKMCQSPRRVKCWYSSYCKCVMPNVYKA